MTDDLYCVHSVDSPIKTRDQDEVLVNIKDVPAVCYVGTKKTHNLGQQNRNSSPNECTSQRVYCTEVPDTHGSTQFGTQLWLSLSEQDSDRKQEGSRRESESVSACVSASQ